MTTTTQPPRSVNTRRRGPEPTLPPQRAPGPQADPAPVEEPRLPHERDQSVDMTDDRPDPVIRQAHDDLARGLRDTDRGPVAERTYQKQK